MGVRIAVAPRPLVVGLVAVAALALTACGGSVLDPVDVARANALAAGNSGRTVPGQIATPDTAVTNVDSNPTTSGTGPSSDGSGPVSSSAGTSGRGGVPTSGGGRPTGGGVTAHPAGVASCTGFRNTTGITDSTITLSNIADISGPQPGIFKAALLATRAYAAYFNSSSRICGRKLAVNSYDSQTDAAGDQVATQRACDESFAEVGSMSAFDSGGVRTAETCRIPEIHAIITNDVRAACGNCFAAESPGGGYFQSSIPDYFTRHNNAAVQKAAMLYVNAAAAVSSAQGDMSVEKKRGWKFVYSSSFDVADFNYGPYVQHLKDSGARIVQMFGSPDMAVRMARAFQSAGYKPDVFLLDGTQYDKTFVGGGSAVDGAVIYVDFTPVEEMASNPELQTYDRWLQQVSPGAQPTYFGLFAWSAARLFAEQATALGGRLTRASLVSRLRAVQDWTSHGLHAPQSVGAKTNTPCARFLQVRNGQWIPYGGTKYYCAGLTHA